VVVVLNVLLWIVLGQEERQTNEKRQQLKERLAALEQQRDEPKERIAVLEAKKEAALREAEARTETEAD